ncbi:MAG: hydrogenase nickel incorporation protein hypA [Phycisphaerales bacterium]|nr:hydrogenase nickel incorporation protein hypA [Phycisphaerales bacterium]
MHEVSIAQSLIDVVLDQLRGERATNEQVTLVRVRIGVFSGVVPAALVSAFGPASEGTALEAARLQIDVVPLAVWCDACGGEQELPTAGPLHCPKCGTRAAHVVRGRELEVVSVELGRRPS